MKQIYIAVPLPELLRPDKIKLVGDRPPDISIGRQPGDHIPQIGDVRWMIHPVETPMALVIWMKEDEIRFNAHLPQLDDALFQVTKKCGIE